MDKILERDQQLDFIKGGCVLIMLFYHVMSMAITYYDVGQFLSRLSFIHASFLFVCGWLVGSYYAPKVIFGQTVIVFWRLLVRGFKLFGLSLVINIAAYAVNIGYSVTKLGEIGSFSEMMHIFFLRSPSRFMAGEIIWEIALFLTLIAPIIAMRRIWLFYLIGTALWIAGFWYVIPFFMSIGTVGIIIGWHLRNKEYFKTLKNKFVAVAFIVLWLLHLIFVFSLTQISKNIPPLAIVISTVEILLWFAVFIIVFEFRILFFLNKYFIFWGHYTLIAYCSQLVIARVVTLLFHPENFILYLCIALALNILAMHFLLCSIDLIRGKSSIVNRGYKLVFA